MPLAKITPPRLAGVIPRRRPCGLIDRVDGRIVWISALAGAGKTTLAAEYAAYRNLRCAWYQLDSGDAEPSTFFHYMRLALKRVRPRLRRLPPLLSPEYAGDIELFTRRFFERFFALLCARDNGPPSPAVMVLDDFQNLNDPVMQDLLRIGLGVAPDVMKILVLSREALPACFAGLRGNNILGVLEDRDVYFAEAETRAFFEQQPQTRRLSEKTVRLIHEKTRGWAAGVRLLGEALVRIPEPGGAEGLPAETIFDFFQQELLSKVRPQTRDFLLKTALLPSMTARLAHALTGLASSGDLLRRMSARNFFVVQSETCCQGEERTYSYHLLLREFLLDQGQAAFSPGQLALLRRNAAAILRDAGDPEDAADLYILGREAELLADLCQDLAPALLRQGRHKTLARWLEHVPECVRQGRPWLHYWGALTIEPWKVQEQRLLLEQAIEGFRKQGDQTGLCLARAEMLMTTLADLGVHPEITVHFQRLSAEVGPNFPFPNHETEARIVLGMIQGATFCHPGHPHIQRWVERGLKLLQTPIPVDQKISLGLNLLLFYIYMGRMPQAERLYLRLKTVAGHKEMPELARLQWLLVKAMSMHLVDPRPDRCLQAVEQGLALAEVSGIHLYDVLLLVIASYMAISRGDRDETARLEELLAPRLAAAVPLGTVNYHCMRCHEHLALGNGPAALQQGLLALETMPQPRSPLPAALILIGLAEACIEADDWPAARSYLQQARQITVGIPEFKGDVLFLFPVAYAALRRGRERVGLRVLNIALARARAGGWLNALYWRPRQLALLCAKALEAGLETDYVRMLVQRHDLTFWLPGTLHSAIPPPLEIRVLGPLSILHDGVQLVPPGGGSGKPLTLLKALIVLGAKNVPEQAVGDILWPEAEGDKAAQSLKFTVHHLRKFLGVRGAIAVKGHTVSLNPRVCSLDLNRFELGCVQVAKAIDDGLPLPEQIALCGSVVGLYQGDFMAQDPAPWLTTTRQKLKQRCLQVFSRLIQLQELSGRPDLAAACCEQALAVDPHHEAFYKTLILIHVRSGRTAEAAAVLRRCRDIFHSDLGMPPSDDLQRLVAGFG